MKIFKIIVINFWLFGLISVAGAQSAVNNVTPDFPNPENVRVDGGLLLWDAVPDACLLYTSPSPRDQRGSRMPSSA